MTIPATKGRVVPVKKGMPMLMEMANSMASTSRKGMLAERKQTAMMMKMAAMEAMLTFLKSTAATSMRSLVMAPSPATTAVGS